MVDHLEDRLEFERLISDTSASLFAAPMEKIGLAVEHALDLVRKFFQADRCALLTVSPDQQVVNVRLASYSEGVPSVPTDLNLASPFPWSSRTLFVERAPVRVSRIDDLPPEADVERQAWIEMPIRSALTLPIETGGGIHHLIVLNTVHRECEWPDEFLPRLRVLGELLASALERQRMFAEYREAEARLSLSADSAGAGIWTLDYRSRVFWATERARRIFGYGPDGVITMDRVMASVHPEDRDRVRDVIERSAHESGAVNVEYRILLPGSGGTRWIASRAQPWFTPSGEPERLMGVSIDITEQKMAEESIHASKTRLDAGADLAGLAYIEVNYRDGTTHADDRFRDICGFRPGPDQPLRDVEFWMEHLHPEDRPAVLEQREKLHDGRIDRLALEYRYLHPDRGQRWIHHLARVVERDAAGGLVATFSVIRDITSRKRIEEDRHDLSRRLIRAHEEERALLARELHDDLTQRLAVLAIDVGRARLDAPDGPNAETMQTVHEGLVRLSEDIHALAYQLHPSILEELGLVDALRAECEQRGRQSRLDLSTDLDPRSVIIGKDAALCLFRVAQEALKNVARHADARSASVSLRPQDGGLCLTVQDDGVGFDPENPVKKRHLGLPSMRERVHLVNGKLDIESAPGRGTAVVAWVPGEEGSS